MFNNLKRIKAVEDLVDTCKHEINKVKGHLGNSKNETNDKLLDLAETQNADLELLSQISQRTIDNEFKTDYIDRKLDKWRENQRENMMLLMEYFKLYFDYENDKKVIKKEK